MKYWLAAVVVLISSILGYGYWHEKTHGALNFSVYDASSDNHYTLLRGVTVTLTDGNGRMLARGQTDPQSGVMNLLHPVLGSCRDREKQASYSSRLRTAWQECFQAQSTWLVSWIEDVRYADISTGPCRLRKVPVTVEKFGDDWWLWWVPLPHVGGKPYSYFKIQLRVDPQQCLVVAGRHRDNPSIIPGLFRCLEPVPKDGAGAVRHRGNPIITFGLPHRCEPLRNDGDQDIPGYI